MEVEDLVEIMRLIVEENPADGNPVVCLRLTSGRNYVGRPRTFTFDPEKGADTTEGEYTPFIELARDKLPSLYIMASAIIAVDRFVPRSDDGDAA